MTNEIKEIIEALKSHSDIVKEYPLTLSIEEQKILLDYITNLQEENERLKNLYTNDKSHRIDYDYFKVLYKKENKDSVINALVYKCEQCRVLYDSAAKNSFENYNLQQRIDKAIKYIKKNKPYWEEWHYDGCGVDDGIEDILKILRGDE